MTDGKHQSLDLAELLPSWLRALRAENKSPRTIDSYNLAATQLLDYLTEHGHPTAAREVTRAEIQDFLTEVLNTRASATAKQRYASLRQWFRWMELEEEIDTNPFDKLRPPKVVEQPVPVLTLDEIRALLATCQSDPGDWKRQRFANVRDEAAIRLFVDTGMRHGELRKLKVSDVDLDLNVAVVLGKGRKFRSAPFGNKTATALDRYLRRRAQHKHADSPNLWLGSRGPITDSAFAMALARRSKAAGLPYRVHPHMFRHTFAHQWLADGGAEGDLQRIAGWESPQMLQRYGASAASERARAAHKRLGLGDKL